MRDFFVPRDMLLYSHEMGMPSDFSVHGFSGGQGEDGSSMTFRTATVSSSDVQPWTLAEITTALWLDAADSATITLNGSTVSQWSDKSGNGRHATQGTATKQPTRTSKYITFDGTDDFMSCPSFTIAQPTSLFIVARVHTLAGERTIINQQYGDTLAPWQQYVNSSGLIIDWRSSAKTPAISANTFFQVAEIQSATNVVDMWKDGNSGTRGAVSNQYANTRQIYIGKAQSFGAIGWMDGDFCETVLVLGAVDVSTRQKLEGYLAHKWDALLGVTTLVNALPSAHPYKSAAPTL